MQTLQIISPTLELNSSGQDVVRIQQRLQDLGFNPGTIDGIFSKTTQLAVIKFQISKNLQSDGIVGIQTLAKLFPIEGRKVKTPSGLVFDIIDGANSNDKRLQQFFPLQPLRNGYNLPRFYISIQSLEELKQQFSEHFQIREFISNEEISNNLKFPYFVPVAIVRLAQALEGLRTRLNNQPLKLSSGYRSPFYSDYQNDPRYISAHRFGTATDIVAVGNSGASISMMKIINEKAFDGNYTPGLRPSGNSPFGFEYTESLEEMHGNADHSHLDMGYVYGYPNELDHLGDLLLQP